MVKDFSYSFKRFNVFGFFLLLSRIPKHFSQILSSDLEFPIVFEEFSF